MNIRISVKITLLPILFLSCLSLNADEYFDSQDQVYITDSEDSYVVCGIMDQRLIDAFKNVGFLFYQIGQQAIPELTSEEHTDYLAPLAEAGYVQGKALLGAMAGLLSSPGSYVCPGEAVPVAGYKAVSKLKHKVDLHLKNETLETIKEAVDLHHPHGSEEGYQEFNELLNQNIQQYSDDLDINTEQFLKNMEQYGYVLALFVPAVFIPIGTCVCAYTSSSVLIKKYLKNHGVSVSDLRMASIAFIYYGVKKAGKSFLAIIGLPLKMVAAGLNKIVTLIKEPGKQIVTPVSELLGEGSRRVSECLAATRTKLGAMEEGGKEFISEACATVKQHVVCAATSCAPVICQSPSSCITDNKIAKTELVQPLSPSTGYIDVERATDDYFFNNLFYSIIALVYLPDYDDILQTSSLSEPLKYVVIPLTTAGIHAGIQMSDTSFESKYVGETVSGFIAYASLTSALSADAYLDDLQHLFQVAGNFMLVQAETLGESFIALAGRSAIPLLFFNQCESGINTFIIPVVLASGSTYIDDKTLPRKVLLGSVILQDSIESVRNGHPESFLLLALILSANTEGGGGWKALGYSVLLVVPVLNYFFGGASETSN